MHVTTPTTGLERLLRIPPDMPPRLIADIEAYNALVALQERLVATAPWYQRLA